MGDGFELLQPAINCKTMWRAVIGWSKNKGGQLEQNTNIGHCFFCLREKKTLLLPPKREEEDADNVFVGLERRKERRSMREKTLLLLCPCSTPLSHFSQSSHSLPPYSLSPSFSSSRNNFFPSVQTKHQHQHNTTPLSSPSPFSLSFL